MNTDNNQNKQLTELSDEELKQVNGGGASIDCNLSENATLPQCTNIKLMLYKSRFI